MQIIKLANPADALTVEVVRAAQKIASASGVELLLLGAQAKVILLENIHSLNPGRATRDIDFAFAIENWKQFDQIKRNLILTKQFRERPGTKQGLLYKSSLIEHEFAVDIIPFGAVQNCENEIAWPPDMDVIMNVSGYQEALESALLVEVADNLIVKVVSLAALALLKILAWSERGAVTRNKDALDFLTLLRTYHEAGNTDRIYNEPDVLESSDYNPETAGAWMLGKDGAAITKENTVREISALLNNKSEELILCMVSSWAENENALSDTKALLTNFTKGLLGPHE